MPVSYYRFYLALKVLVMVFLALNSLLRVVFVQQKVQRVPLGYLLLALFLLHFVYTRGSKGFLSDFHLK